MNHDNFALREEVDGIRRRRLQLNSIFERLKVDIRQRSSQLADFVEETAFSRAIHGDANQRVDVMKRHRELERRQFKQEVLRLREQLKLQDWERKEVEVQLKRADTGVQKKKELIIPEEETTFSEGEMMRRIMKTAFLNCIQRRHIKQHQKSIEVFEQAFSTIKQSTGIEHIEEIVKIFVNLESRNFSLLTYVNVMNREIEALEGVRRERRLGEDMRQQAEQQHEEARQQALADIQRQLQSSTLAIQEGHEAIVQHRDLIEELIPILLEISQRIEQEFEKLRTAGSSPAEDGLRLPAELREETMPECLEVIEIALGRFRDLLPGNAGEKDGAFPCTALGSVRSLPPKRLTAQSQNQPLVKQQELPSAFSLVTDEQGNPTQKRAHAQMTAVQKAELLDEESDEEDFDRGPLKIKDLRARAEQSANKRKRRGGNIKREAIVASSSPSRSNRMSSAEGGLAGATDGSPKVERSIPGGARPVRAGTGEALGMEKDDELLEDGSAASESGAPRDSLVDAPRDKRVSAMPPTGGGEADKGASTSSSPRKLGRGKLALQALDSDGPEVSEEEVEKCFLRRYKMTREELQVMADHMQVHIHNLCFLKQEFDQYDQDQSGYIDSRELKTLLKKLGEDLSDEALDVAFKQLDSDGSGEIEFFEFTEWFTSTDT